MAMLPVISGCILITLIMLDVTRTTLTTKGEGPVSALVSGSFRKIASLAGRRGHRLSEATGAVSILALGSVWVAGLWAGWVLIFLGLPDAIEHSTQSSVDLYDLVYFVGFTLSTLGIGDITPNGASAQVATTLASFNGLLVVTLIVTYAISVVSGVVARRVLAYRISLAGDDSDEFLTAFSNVDDFAAWVADLKKELIFCTEQRLAYPILDNFISREPSCSLAIQLARLGLATLRLDQQYGLGGDVKRELDEFWAVLDRYTLLTGMTDEDLGLRLRKLAGRDGWKPGQDV